MTGMMLCMKCHRVKMEVLTCRQGKLVCRNCLARMREEELKEQKKRATTNKRR